MAARALVKFEHVRVALTWSCGVNILLFPWPGAPTGVSTLQTPHCLGESPPVGIVIPLVMPVVSILTIWISGLFYKEDQVSKKNGVVCFFRMTDQFRICGKDHRTHCGRTRAPDEKVVLEVCPEAYQRVAHGRGDEHPAGTRNKRISLSYQADPFRHKRARNLQHTSNQCAMMNRGESIRCRTISITDFIHGWNQFFNFLGDAVFSFYADGNNK